MNLLNALSINGSKIELGKKLFTKKKGDFLGVGIIHHPNLKMVCFATFSGQVMGKTICKIL